MNYNNVKQTPTELKFNDEFYTKILCRNKIQTTRTSLKPGIRIGKIFEAVFPDPKNKRLPLIAEKITIKMVCDLSEKDARREGYLSKENFKIDLKRIYPNLNFDSIVYCIKFHFDDGPGIDTLDLSP